MFSLCRIQTKIEITAQINPDHGSYIYVAAIGATTIAIRAESDEVLSIANMASQIVQARQPG